MLKEFQKLSILFMPGPEKSFDRWLLPICGYILVCIILLYLTMLIKGM